MPKKKKGVDQRVKGNAKSASSQRMVDLMGSGMGGVIGFSTVSAGVPHFGARGGAKGVGDASNEVLYGESSHFQVVMKQLGKRDSTTKLKALQEFASLVEQLDPAATIGVLSLWTVMYNKLSTDNDNRVRDHTHRALRAVVEVVHDGMESYLRSIIGCWVAGMCDPYVLSAASARAAFEKAFSAEKQEELYSVMLKPIIQHVSELVLKMNPDTYSDPKVMSSEERVQRYERAVCMAVSSVKLVVRNLSADQLTSNRKLWEDLLAEKKLWALTKHGSASVRAAAFGVVPTVCDKLPDFVQQKGKLFSSAVLGSLGEKDPLVVGPVWEAALMIIAKTEMWYTNVNIEKALLPGLWSLLNEGGYGSASIAYPCLLPLISRLMEKDHDNVKFARTFLENLFAGLSLDHPQTSRKEFEVQLRTFRECLLYLMAGLDHQLPQMGYFIGGAFDKVMNMVSVSLRGGLSVMQTEVLFSNIVRILGSLLQLQTKCPSLQPHLSNLQLDISKKVSDTLEQEGDVEGNFSRVGSLLKCFFSHTLWSNLERKTVREPSCDELSVTNLLPQQQQQSGSTREQRDQTCDDSVRDFIAPTICSLCSCSIAEVSSAPHLLHSQLLLTMLRLYTTKSLIKAVFSSLQSSQAHLLREHRGEKMLHKKLLIICGILNKAARAKGQEISEHPEFSSNVIEAIMLLIKSDFVETTSASMFLSEFIKPSPIVLPLVTLKLCSTGQQALLELVVQQVKQVYGQLFKDLEQNSSPFLWTFLRTLFSDPSDSCLKQLQLAGPAFESVCSILLDQLQDAFTLPKNVLKSMLEVVATTASSLLEDNMNSVTNLLSGLLHWCLFVRSQSDLVEEMVSCYRDLLAALPDSSSIIHSLPSLITHHSSDGLFRYVVSAHFYFTLHQDVLPDHVLGLYEPLVRNITSLKERWVPLSMLETFCSGSVIYSPLSTDLKSSQVTATLPPLLRPLFYPLAALVEPSLLQDLASHLGVPEEERDMVTALCELEGGADIRSQLRDVLFGGRGEGIQDETREMLDYMGVSVISLLPLVMACLTDSAVRRASTLESKLRDLLQDVLKNCLECAVNNRRHRWIRDLVQALHEANRTLLERPTLSLTLAHIFTTLEMCYIEDPDPWQTILESFVQPSDCSSMFNAFCAMDCKMVEKLVSEKAEDTEKDPYFLLFLLSLCPKDLQLPHSACHCLRDIAKGDSSNTSLFESLRDTSQEQLAFTVLELYRVLVGRQSVNKDSWDFLLCSLVSLTQLLGEEEVEALRKVNVTVFACHILRLCHDVARYCNSSECSGALSVEWKEFFHPALQECLLALYLKKSGEIATQHTLCDPCLSLQQQQLCRAVVTLSPAQSPDMDLFRDLVGRVTSRFYPEQVTSYQLCKCALESFDVTTEDSTSDGLRKTINVLDLQRMFTEAQDKVNMDLVFLEDRKTAAEDGWAGDGGAPFCSENVYHHSTSYLFIWLLMMEAVRHCTAEVRAVMVKWLKDLSLFDHFLQGLFKYLNEDSDKSTTLAVSARPSLEQLSFVAYSSVSKQLPSMLRQWHLTLDRHTSSLVTRFTTRFVSPDLQHADLRTVSRSNNTSVGNMDVRVYSGASEVAVTYKVDDFCIELFVCLPDSYPLQPPTIREGRRVKMDPSQWRKWMLQLTIFVTNQNGSLLDGLLLWKSNLDKHFSGVEECMICFSVIHGSTYALPKMTCRTCKKKFHSNCLYKWFNTSTKSSCPLCRNIF